jgi:hypothetical protein
LDRKAFDPLKLTLQVHTQMPLPSIASCQSLGFFGSLHYPVATERPKRPAAEAKEGGDRPPSPPGLDEGEIDQRALDTYMKSIEDARPPPPPPPRPAATSQATSKSFLCIRVPTALSNVAFIFITVPTKGLPSALAASTKTDHLTRHLAGHEGHAAPKPPSPRGRPSPNEPTPTHQRHHTSAAPSRRPSVDTAHAHRHSADDAHLHKPSERLSPPPLPTSSSARQLPVERHLPAERHERHVSVERQEAVPPPPPPPLANPTAASAGRPGEA